MLVLEKDDFGGQITITDEVVNYPGVARTSGLALTATMRQQTKDFGVEFLSAEATGLDLDGDVKTVHTSRGDLKTFGVLLATGASPRKLGFAGEAEYAGRGVAYCATCDGEFFTGREVLVIGGGFAAAEEAVFLTKYASKVTVLVREDDFTCDASVAAETKKNPKIEVRYHTEIEGVEAGQGGLRSAMLRDVHSGETTTWQPADQGTFGVFVFAGYVPATDLVCDLVELDDYGCVVTHDYLETSVPGVYAVGDLRVKNLGRWSPPWPTARSQPWSWSATPRPSPKPPVWCRPVLLPPPTSRPRLRRQMRRSRRPGRAPPRRPRPPVAAPTRWPPPARSASRGSCSPTPSSSSSRWCLGAWPSRSPCSWNWTKRRCPQSWRASRQAVGRQGRGGQGAGVGCRSVVARRRAGRHRSRGV